MSAKDSIRIIRINPIDRKIDVMFLHAPRTANQESIMRKLRIMLQLAPDAQVGHHVLSPAIEGPGMRDAIVAFGGLAVDEAMKGWRFPGCEDHAGFGVICGKGAGGGMTNCPVDKAWVEKMTVFLDGEDPAALKQRAEALAPMLDAEMVTVLLSAKDLGPMAAGDSVYWLDGAHATFFSPAQVLGLTDQVTDGQRLTRLGEAVLTVLQLEDERNTCGDEGDKESRYDG